MARKNGVAELAGRAIDGQLSMNEQAQLAALLCAVASAGNSVRGSSKNHLSLSI